MEPASAKLNIRIGSSRMPRMINFFRFLMMDVDTSISHCAWAMELAFRNSKTCLGKLMVPP